MARTTRIVGCLAVLVSALTLLLASNPARSQPGTEPAGIIKAQRVVVPAPDDESVSPQVEQSVEARSSQGMSLPKRAETAVTDVRMQECRNGSGAETRLGLMQHTSLHGHCAR